MGVGITIENLFRLSRADIYYLGDRPEDLAFLLERCPGLGFCYDVGHANLEPAALGWPERLGAHLRAVHVHDNDGYTDLHAPPGDERVGSVDWAAVLAALQRAGYHGPLILEGGQRTLVEGRRYLEQRLFPQPT
jgi:sugar phosphate isomerase/epimerase